MAFATQQVSAEIIPFPQGGVRKARILDAQRRAEEARIAALPVVDIGGWYHEAAIRQSERDLHA